MTLLDLPAHVGRRAESVRFDLLSLDLTRIGELHPQAGGTITNDTNATVIRTLRGLTLRGDEAAAVDMLTDRLRPVWRLENGEEWPLGVFWFVDRTTNRSTGESEVPVELWDGGALLDEPLRSTFGVSAGGSLDDALDRLSAFTQAPLVLRSLSGRVSLDPIAWPAGTPLREAIRAVCRLAGFLPPHFDHSGALRLRPVPSLDGAVDHQYRLGADSRVVSASIVEADNLLDAPNGHLVVSTSASAGEIAGLAWVDPDLPHSRERTGRERVEVHREQGIQSTEVAQEMAVSFAAQHPSDRQEITFTSTPDPRHDTFDLVDFDGVVYREQAWSLELRAGGAHQHRLNRAGVVWEP